MTRGAFQVILTQAKGFDTFYLIALASLLIRFLDLKIREPVKNYIADIFRPSTQLLSVTTEKNVAGSCALNFGATDLPHCYFEALYPKLFRAIPEVDLVSTAWRPGPSKVR